MVYSTHTFTLTEKRNSLSELETGPVFAVVSTLSSSLTIKLSMLPTEQMESLQCLNFICENGLFKYYSDIVIIIQTVAMFQYRSLTQYQRKENYNSSEFLTAQQTDRTALK